MQMGEEAPVLSWWQQDSTGKSACMCRIQEELPWLSEITMIIYNKYYT